MIYKLQIVNNDEILFSSNSNDLDDIYSDIRKFKETPSYKKLRDEQIKDINF